MNEDIIEEYLNKLQEFEPISMTTLVAASSIFTIFNVALQIYKSHLAKSARRCKDLSGKEQALCMLRAKAAAKEVQLKALKKGSERCAKSKNPDKCKQSFNAKMSKVGGEQGYYKSRFSQLSNQKYSE